MKWAVDKQGLRKMPSCTLKQIPSELIHLGKLKILTLFSVVSLKSYWFLTVHKNIVTWKSVGYCTSEARTFFRELEKLTKWLNGYCKNKDHRAMLAWNLQWGDVDLHWTGVKFISVCECRCQRCLTNEFKGWVPQCTSGIRSSKVTNYISILGCVSHHSHCPTGFLSVFQNKLLHLSSATSPEVSQANLRNGSLVISNLRLVQIT